MEGSGARWGSKVYNMQVPLGYENMYIAHLEMLNILVAMHVQGPQWYSKAIQIACDNQAVVMVLNSGKTCDLTLAAIAQNIVMEAAQFDIFLKTVHIMGVVNEIADSQSRWAIPDLFRRKFSRLLPKHMWLLPLDVLNINWCI